MTEGGRRDADPADRPSDDVVAAVQAELVRALKRAEALRAEAVAARDALEHSHRQKDEFLAMLAHELRNPLGPILNAAETLQAAAASDPSLARATEILVRQASLLTRLVDDLLDAARISRGKLELRRQRVDFVALVASVVEDLASSFRARDIELVSSLPDSELWVSADPQRLTQAIGNLLSNAAKFTDARGRVTVELAEEPDGEGRLTIEDTGIGMSDELVSRVFDPFSQARGNEPRNPSGLGLGTAIARGIIDLHGGTIAARSEGRGSGSRFTIRLPLDSAGPPQAKVREDAPPAFTKRRVVVIDDNVDAAEIIQVMLEGMGHVVAVAHDGRTGTALVKQLAPDLVICDLGLPGDIDGLAVARLLSDLDPRPYLVALTGYGREEDRENALRAGFALHVTKPVSMSTLEEIASGRGNIT